MARLPETAQRAAGEAEVKDYSAFEGGLYKLRLSAVDTTKTGPAGPYWVWQFTVVEGPDEKAKNRKLWMNTSLAESAAWKLREVFDALGYSLDSDTEEMIGDECAGEVAKVKQEQGARAGQMTNQLNKVMTVAAASGESPTPVGAGAAVGNGSGPASKSSDPWA